jgi:hypothetical protein
MPFRRNYRNLPVHEPASEVLARLFSALRLCLLVVVW